MVRQSLVLMGVFLGGVASNTSAQDIQLNPYVSIVEYSDSCIVRSSAGPRGCEGRFDGPGAALKAGLRMSFEIMGPIVLEADYGFGPLAVSKEGTISPASDERYSDANAHSYLLSLSAFWPEEGRLQGILGAGIGGIAVNSGAGVGLGGDTWVADLTTVLGAGVAIRLSQTSSLRTDFRVLQQHCSESGPQIGFECRDGAQLNHVEFGMGLSTRL